MVEKQKQCRGEWSWTRLKRIGLEGTYVIDGNKLVVVLENHDLIFCMSGLGVFPVIDGYLNSLGSIFARHMEHATSWCVLIAT
jgi:hypothetical protein